MDVVVGVPIKPFTAAKKRLAAVLGAEDRVELARYLAAHTLEVVGAAGLEVVVLSANREVGRFANDLGHSVQMTPRLDLNEAATRFRIEIAPHRPWLLVHADLPFLSSEALALALAGLASHDAVITPSPDGGTPVMGANDDGLKFAYGPSSFHRHLRQLPAARVIVDYRLSCDIDRPRDLEVARSRIDRLSTLLGS